MKRGILAILLGAAMGCGTANAGLIDFAAVYAGVTSEPDLQAGPGAPFEMDGKVNVGAAFGWDLAPEISVGADLMWTKAKYAGFPGFELESMSVMAAGYYNFDLGWKLRPFIGAGLGGVQVVGTTPSGGGSDFVFGYEAMAGLTYPLDGNLALALGYKYQAADDATIDGATPVEYKSHNVSLGLIFDLN